MSEAHYRRLAKVRDEKQAAEEAVGLCLGLYSELRSRVRSDPADFERALRNLEKTYFIRLCADLEAMLFRHLRDYWPSIGTSVDEAAHNLSIEPEIICIQRGTTLWTTI